MFEQVQHQELSLLLRGSQLFERFLLDNYVKVEALKLRWVHFYQDKIHFELYQGMQDLLNVRENDAGQYSISGNVATLKLHNFYLMSSLSYRPIGNLGRRIILSSSFVSSP